MPDGFPSLISPILSDQPADKDQLNFAPYAKTLADIIADSNVQTPLTIGIFGSWGSGKTSLMNMIKKRLDDMEQAQHRAGQEETVCPHLTVWFNAWLYSQDQTLWRALILRVLAEVRRVRGGDLGMRDELDRLAEQIYQVIEPLELGTLSITAADLLRKEGTGSAQITMALQSGLDLLENAARAHPDGELAVAMALRSQLRRTRASLEQARVEALERFRKQFKALVAKTIVPYGYLVVFVDDLDRCLPEKTIEVLEAIKLFLDVPGCVFVLALDQEAIVEAIRTRYKGEVKGQQYLDKIIQLPFLLPPIATENMRDFVESLVPHLPDPHCVEVFAEGLLRNPRQVKRTINVFLLLWKLSRQKLPKSIQPVRLAKVVAIQHSHPDLYALLREVPRLLRDLEAYFRAEAELEASGMPDTSPEDHTEVPLLSPQLQTFTGRATLRSLLTLHSVDTPDVNFVDLTPQDIRPYIYLTHRVEAQFERPTEVSQPEMVHIPDGKFTMGSEEYDDEKPVQKLHLPGFRVARYPVTNFQYRAFVRDTGVTPPPHWEGDEYPEELGDHPVVYVTWHDSVAYCQWLTEKTGKPYRLPTEAEWEKAARGSDGRKWPWGNEWDASKCNSKESGVGHTIPPGQYSPQGDSPRGVAEMAGNVWEWCQSLFWPYPYRNDDSREDLEAPGERVLRGGAFSNERNSVRCAFRTLRLPRHRDKHIGFRVALSFPTSLSPDQ